MFYIFGPTNDSDSQEFSASLHPKLMSFYIEHNLFIASIPMFYFEQCYMMSITLFFFFVQDSMLPEEILSSGWNDSVQVDYVSSY